MYQPIFTVRAGRSVATFDQDNIPKNFFQVAKSLDFRIAVTGGTVLTHEISPCMPDDWNTLLELCVQ